MHSPLHRLLAQARVDDLRRAGADSALARRPRLAARRPPEGAVTLRFGFPDDSVALGRLAALDSSLPPPQPVLLAEVAGELRAALSLSDGAVVSDPFYPSRVVVDLLRARARQLAAGEGLRATAPWHRRVGSGSRFRPAAWR